MTDTIRLIAGDTVSISRDIDSPAAGSYGNPWRPHTVRDDIIADVVYRSSCGAVVAAHAGFRILARADIRRAQMTLFP